MRTIVETDAADEVISRTVVTRADGPLITIAQTDGSGHRLSTIVTRIDPLGERTTTVSDGEGSLVAEIRTNRWGVETDVTRGSASLGAATFELPPQEPQPRSPPADAIPHPGYPPLVPRAQTEAQPIAVPFAQPSIPSRGPGRSDDSAPARPKIAPAPPPVVP